MASLLDVFANSAGVILGGAAQDARTAIARTTSAASDTFSSIIGSSVNKGVSLIDSIKPNNNNPASPVPTTQSSAASAIPTGNRDLLLLGAALGLAAYLVFKK